MSYGPAGLSHGTSSARFFLFELTILRRKSERTKLILRTSRQMSLDLNSAWTVKVFSATSLSSGNVIL